MNKLLLLAFVSTIAANTLTSGALADEIEILETSHSPTVADTGCMLYNDGSCVYSHPTITLYETTYVLHAGHHRKTTAEAFCRLHNKELVWGVPTVGCDSTEICELPAIELDADENIVGIIPVSGKRFGALLSVTCR